MQKSFATVEEMIADEMFLSWFYKESDEKVTTWENWLEENPVYVPMASDAVQLMASLEIKENPVSSFRIEAAYRQVMAKLERAGTEQAPVISMKPSRRKWWMSAAAAILILAAGLIYYTVLSPAKSVIETQYGQVCQQDLPDGSKVMLNANTVVTLSKGWEDGSDREVWLKGEAFFQVKKTPQKNKFVVHTEKLDIIVTGTQFNVRTTGDKTSVLLTEGSVIIKTSDGEEIYMQPGDFVEINNNKTEKKTINQENILAWKENKLNFDKTPMKEVAVMISNHYGVTVKLADDTVNEKTITGMMPNNNLEDLLKALEATTEFKITRTDKTIIIAQP